ncbi:MAG: hydrogenase, partial [Gammaproteobacteria bacterium]|nr:hydrogenase [Gammaproteobacteria bacterium]
MSGFDAGRVRLRLMLEGDVVAAVEVACERPNVAAALAGKPADEAVALVPLIYSLCGQAQGIAARAALAAARGT